MPVPWIQILQWVPPILELSRDLLQRSRRAPTAGASGAPPLAAAAGRSLEDGSPKALQQGIAELRQQVTTLEDNERRQAELVADMAAQLAKLSEAVVALHRQSRIMALVTGALLLVTLLALGTVVVLLQRVA